MSDYNSSIPARTESPGDIQVKVVDGTITSRQLTVNADGSINITDNSTSLTVDAVDLDIRNLVFATDKVDASGSTVALDGTTLAALESITVQNGAGAAAVNIQDGGNTITVDGTVELGATTLAALETITVSNLPTTVDTNYGTVGASTIRSAAQLGNATGAADFNNGAIGAQTLRTAANLAVAGANVTSANPVPVTIIDASPGTAISDYNTAAALAAAATSTHTYTSVGNFNLNHIWASASGKLKIVITVNAVTKFVGFNSTANPNIPIDIPNTLLATSGQTVTIARTNLDNQAMDVYSTISGYNG